MKRATNIRVRLCLGAVILLLSTLVGVGNGAARTTRTTAPAATRLSLASTGPVLVVVAHPDDESLAFAGIIEQAITDGRPVTVAVVTNGAAVESPLSPAICGAADGAPAGYATTAVNRDTETVNAMRTLGGADLGWSAATSSHVLFLGYPDGGVATILGNGSFSDPSGLDHTFAVDAIPDADTTTCNGDYHYLRTGGTHATLTAANLNGDIAALLAQVKPTDIYTHAVSDGHSDHAAVARAVIAAVRASTLTVDVHSSLVHETGDASCMPASASWWPNPEQTSDPAGRSTPDEPFLAPPIFATGDADANDTGFLTCPDGGSPVGRDWGPLGPPTDTVTVPTDMQATDLSVNKKWLTIEQYVSQLGCPDAASCGYMHGFVKNDEILWTQTVSASGPPVPVGWPRLRSTDNLNVGDTLSPWYPTGVTPFVGDTSITYQWLRCDPVERWTCTPITGETTSGHTITTADGGHALRLAIVGHNSAGASPTVYSGSTDPISAGPVNTALPAVSGTARVGETLSASTGTWTPSSTYAYAWQRCDATGTACSPIAGASAATYQVVAADLGAKLRVTVRATDAGGSTDATSAATGVVQQMLPPTNTALPAVSGTARVGETLSASTGTWTPSSTYAYAWQRCDATGSACSPIAGASAATYQVVAADLGVKLRVTVTATDAGGSTAATSAATGVVQQMLPPTNTALPAVSGTARVGETLSASTGTWTPSSTYAYAWQRCDATGSACSPIAGATAATYQVVAADLGATLRVTVTATDAGGSTAASSVATAAVAAPPPPPPPAPVVPPAGGGGGGGGGGLAADLTLEGSVSSQAAKQGDTIVWTFRVVDANLGPAVDAYVDLQLSSNLTLVATTATRGPGCGVLPSGIVHCFVDWLSGDASSATVTLTTTAAADGTYSVTGKVGQLIPDSKPENDTLVLTASTPAPPSTPPVIPAVPKPSISIVKATPARSGVVTIRVAIVGWIVTAKSTKRTAGGVGYWRIWVDGRRNAISRNPSTGTTRVLAPGKRVVQVELVTASGKSLARPALSKRVTVTVPKRTHH